MGMLSRYQRPGGFIQLIQLIETCGKQKQDNFLNIIEGEDPRWARAVREKMLTIEKMLNWNDNTIAEVSKGLAVLTLATAMHGLSSEQSSRLLQTHTHAQKRTIDDLFKTNSPSPAEISAAFLKIIEEARAMMLDGRLRAEKFAPELIISENIEELLAQAAVPLTPAVTSERSTPTAQPAAKAINSAELLQKKIRDLVQENERLRAEVQELREKLRRQSAA